MASSNVVGAVTQLVGKGASAAPYPATPAALGNLCGYPAAKASGLRVHMGRRWGLRASMFGGQWPAYTHAQWRVLMGLAPGEVTAQGQVRALAVHNATAKRAGKPPVTPLYKVGKAAGSGARTAKRTAQVAAQAAPAAADTTAQAQA